MKRALMAFAACAVPFTLMDAAWLSTAWPRLYQPAIGHLISPNIDWTAAALFYVIYLGGLAAFAVLPSASVRQAAQRGAGLGFFAYATYDLTNQATMVGWQWSVTLADLAWGTFASGSACAIAAAVLLRARR